MKDSKKDYISPEFEVVKFSFEAVLANINWSKPEDFTEGGDDVDW